MCLFCAYVSGELRVPRAFHGFNFEFSLDKIEINVFSL